MEIVNTTIPLSSGVCDRTIRRLVGRYPFMRTELLSATAFQRPIRTLVLGRGPRKVLFTAAHHANEWITGWILLKFAQDFARDYENGDGDARALWEAVTVYMIPMVDPDGVDLVLGEASPIQLALAMRIARDYPQIPFPQGWKANLLGTDLNLNYPAGWEQARKIKFSQGYVSPAPRDFVGKGPLDQLETQALAGYTRFLDPELVLAYHTQGKEIYWKYLDIEVPGARELGEKMARASGYRLADTPYASGFAGFKDWFIQEFHRPGYTIEAGQGENPLPLSQFDEIYRDNLPILLLAARGE